MKLKYDYLTNRLWKINPDSLEYSYEVSEESQFTANFNGQGFRLGESSWITFTLYSNQIRAFYKQISKAEKITYFAKIFRLSPLNNLPLVVPSQYRQIVIEFTKEDIVIKDEKGNWVKKRD